MAKSDHARFADTDPVIVPIDGVERKFDIDDRKLPKWVEQRVRTAGNYPYDEKLRRKEYEKNLEALRVELVKLQSWLHWLQESGRRVPAGFEGRDAAGKGGTIARVIGYGPEVRF